MYTSTYKAIVTFVVLALVAIWGTIALVSAMPQRPEKPPTYVDLYTECMRNQYGVGTNECKELAIKEMEKQNERQNQGSTGQPQGDSSRDSKEQ